VLCSSPVSSFGFYPSLVKWKWGSKRNVGGVPYLYSYCSNECGCGVPYLIPELTECGCGVPYLYSYCSNGIVVNGMWVGCLTFIPIVVTE
ncbi:hypothetical protein STEG23_024334, partial [Scotinomys teguina]